ncbi:MAG: polyhydroxyalkanoate synthesis repressor PhaR [Deltaproteobacteria bacterium]|nr:polyhydroxyalkanoate synthesis repressor PhaR [Deltaproteobacteria bacterium]
MRTDTPRTIKKYNNRRLYDTQSSRYITLEELEALVREGADVKVLDATTGADLTQATLTQVIIEGRGAARLLPAPLLQQLIRMGDDVLAEFLGRYLTLALELYLQARQGAHAMATFNPLGVAPMQAAGALSRMLQGANPWFSAGGPAFAPPFAPPTFHQPYAPPEPRAPPDELERLRLELEALRQAVAAGAPRPPEPPDNAPAAEPVAPSAKPRRRARKV